MKIVDEEVLKMFRGPGRCELCGRSCQKREPHHVIARGMGSGRRLDIKINLIAVGSTRNFECTCHSTKVDSVEGQERCREVIAARERTTPEAIEEAVNFILRLDKHSSAERIKEKIVREVSEDAVARLIVKTMVECGKL